MISEVAKAYARALYDISKKANKANAVLEELRALKGAVKQNKDIGEFVHSPVISPEQKREALKAALTGKVSQEMTNFLTLLTEKNRLSQLTAVAEAFEEISDQDHGVSRGVVKSATKLSGDAQKKLEEQITKATGRKVILSFEEDPTLLGGLVAQVGGWTFDDSLESHLLRMNDELNRRVN